MIATICSNNKNYPDIVNTLNYLWEDMFKYIGITNYEIVPQIDF